MFYIIKNNKVVSTVETGIFDKKDLDSRGEVAIEQKEIILLPADYINGKIMPHEYSSKELKERKKLSEEAERHKLIHEEVHKIAEERLIAKGVIK